jgi:polynucleotide 5'-triphosphatase
VHLRFPLILHGFYQQQHKHYNNLLNQLKTASSQPTHIGSPVDYSHLYLTDTFYATDGNDRDKVRVTRDDKTGTVLESMRKIRLGDLNIYNPKQNADWRVSVNLEVPSM